MRSSGGFTLAELLIALVILGVIATFTIPKVLSTQQSTRNNAIVKEAASIVSGSYEAYKQGNTVTTGFKASHLTPYINYVAIDTTSTIDRSNNLDVTCSATLTCYRLHNGATLMLEDICSLAVLGNTRGVLASVDPNGIASATNDANAGVWLILFYNGRISTLGVNSVDNSCGSWTANSANDPPWLSWN